MQSAYDNPGDPEDLAGRLLPDTRVVVLVLRLGFVRLGRPVTGCVIEAVARAPKFQRFNVVRTTDYNPQDTSMQRVSHSSPLEQGNGKQIEKRDKA